MLPEYLSETPAAFHLELMRDLESGKRLLARVAPRGHAKSTLAALAYPLWRLCEGRSRNIVIITHERSLATQFVRDIRRELETNEKIRAQYGDLTPAASSETSKGRTGRASSLRTTRAKWAESHFTAANGVTVQAKGAGSSIRGTRVGPHRPDLILCDDIECDEQVAREEGRRKLETWLRRVVMPALAPGGQLVVMGSLLHHDSLLANLRDKTRFPGCDYRVYRALEATPDEAGVFRLQSLWPARWSVERLQAERARVGTLAFEQEYQANPIDTGLRAFREEWLRGYDPGLLDGRRDLIPLMAVDPATGVAGGDYFALWIGSVDPRDGVIYTRELTLERIGVVEQIQRILEAVERCRPVRIGIETTAYQAALKDFLEEESRRAGRYLPIVGLRPIANKRARIAGSAAFYAKGLFRLPAGLPADVEQQFLEFPAGRHDDAPDVCVMAIELARAFRGSGAVEGGTEKANPFGYHGSW